jgi:thymidine phosphorylase
MIELLGGDPRVCDEPALLPRAAETVMLKADRAGYLNHMDTMGIGQAAQLLGAGRATKDDVIDPAVGLKVKVRVGDRIEAGMVMAELYVNRRDHLEAAIEKVHGSLTVDDRIPQEAELIYKRIRSREGQGCED